MCFKGLQLPLRRPGLLFQQETSFLPLALPTTTGKNAWELGRGSLVACWCHGLTFGVTWKWWIMSALNSAQNNMVTLLGHADEVYCHWGPPSDTSSSSYQPWASYPSFSPPCHFPNLKWVQGDAIWPLEKTHTYPQEHMGFSHRPNSTSWPI